MKRLLRWRPLGVACAAASAIAGAPAVARATDCATLQNPVYMTGGNSPKPMIAKVATALTNASNQRTIVYQAPGNCLGIDAIVAAAGSSGNRITGTASYWDAAGKEQTCNLSITGDAVQVGVGNTYPELCPEVAAVPADFGDFTGPVAAMDLVVPSGSSQTSISAEGLYFVYGFGAASAAAPWTTEATLFHRSNTSAVSLLIASAIGVPISKMKGPELASNTLMVQSLAAAPTPETTLGMVGDDYAVANPNTIRVLAYQHTGQSCGYFPSSSQTSNDHRNVRDGHYWLWGYTHFYARVDGTGAITDPDAKAIVGYFTRQTIPPTGLDILSIEVTTGNIPQCAMEASRTKDLGALQSYAPDEPCGCYYDATATGHTSCQACVADDDCPAGATHCRFGYCEVN